MGFLVRSTYDIVLVRAGYLEGRYERVLQGISRVWKSRAPSKLVGFSLHML